MHELDRRDQEWVESLKRELEVVEEGGAPPLDRWLPDFQRLLGLDKLLFYGVRLEAEHALSLSFCHSEGMPVGHERFSVGFDAVLRAASPGRWGLFNPARPEPEQRNRALFLPPATEASRLLTQQRFLARHGVTSQEDAQAVRAGTARSAEYMARVGLAQDWQLRVLVCEGDWLLAWVGGFRAEPPGERERLALQALVPAIQRRLGLERLAGGASLLAVGLSAALEEVSRPAFLVDAQGAVQHANTLGSALLEQHPSATRRQLEEVVRSRGALGGYTLTPLGGAGLAPHFLLVAHRTHSDGQAERLQRAARRWGLTPRQTQVLALAAQGESNRAIAGQLGCSEHTVELHMTALLRKADVESRAALVAHFWTRL